MTDSAAVIREQVEPPIELLDALYDALVRVRIDRSPFDLLARWAGVDAIAITLDEEDETGTLALISPHDGIRRGTLRISWPDGTSETVTQMERLRSVADHIARALAYRSELVGTRQQAEVFASGLDRLSVGVLTLRDGGRVIDANRIARRILDQRDGLSLIDDRLCAAQPADQKTMRQLIDAVITGQKEQGGMQLQRPSGEPDLHLLVLSRPARAGVIRAGVRLLLRDPACSAVHSRAALSALYGLTDAEAAITLHLVNGEAPETVEQRFAIRHNTMRAHLRSIYAKLDVGSHAELIYTILSGAGGMALNSETDLPVFEPLGPLVL